MDIGGSSRPRARKPYRCTLCGRMIEKREVYYRVAGLWDHQWTNWAAHTICEKLYKSDPYDDEVYQIGWQDFLHNTTRETIEVFLTRFPPDDEEQHHLATQKRADLRRLFV